MLYVTNNIIRGNAEILGVRTSTGIEYVLPGGYRTKSRRVAEEYAVKFDKIITANLSAYNRKILKS